jgi:hypothetical protein
MVADTNILRPAKGRMGGGAIARDPLALPFADELVGDLQERGARSPASSLEDARRAAANKSLAVASSLAHLSAVATRFPSAAVRARSLVAFRRSPSLGLPHNGRFQPRPRRRRLAACRLRRCRCARALCGRRDRRRALAAAVPDEPGASAREAPGRVRRGVASMCVPVSHQRTEGIYADNRYCAGNEIGPPGESLCCPNNQ